MTSFFSGKNALRMDHKYMMGTDIAAGNLAAPVHFHTLKMSGALYNLKNTTNVVLRLFVRNPDRKDDDPQNNLVFWTELEPGETWGHDMLSAPQHFELPAQTQIYVCGVTIAGADAAPTSGRLRSHFWG
jgi:hypothetical protein